MMDIKEQQAMAARVAEYDRNRQDKEFQLDVVARLAALEKQISVLTKLLKAQEQK